LELVFHGRRHTDISAFQFVSLAEGLYCDMTTREVQALCTDEVTENCFDLNVAEKSMTGRVSRDVTQHITKTFSRVLVWDGK